MSIRRVAQELEARLLPPKPGFFNRSCGKLERKWYGGGEERLKILLKNLAVPDGTVVAVTAAARPIANVTIDGGAGRFDTDDGWSEAIPAMEAGETVEVTHDGFVLARGTLEVD